MRPGPLSQQTDEQLAACARSGSNDAFAEIVRRYEPVLRTKCTRIAGRNLADDALAQTWLQAFAALRRPSGPPALKPWLHRVARNCSIDQLRARRQQESVLPVGAHASDSPDAELERKQSLRDLLKGLSTLPENQRDALVLREFEGRSYAQIAEWVEEPPTGIHQLIFRARSALRRGACALAPWTPVRTLFQQLAALAPGGSGGSVRLGLAMIAAALVSGGGVSSGVATAPGDRASVERVHRSGVEVARDAAPPARPASVRTRQSSVVRLAFAGPRKKTISLGTLVSTPPSREPDAPPEIVAGEDPAPPAPASPPASSEELAPDAEPRSEAPAPQPVTATPAMDAPSDPATTEVSPESDPAPEQPPATESAPKTDDHPGRGDGPPPWAPAKGHGKHVSA